MKIPRWLDSLLGNFRCYRKWTKAKWVGWSMHFPLNALHWRRWEEYKWQNPQAGCSTTIEDWSGENQQWTTT